MGLGKLVKDVYQKSVSYAKREKAFITASALASAACATDALTTKLGMVQNPVLRISETNNFAAYLINEMGVNKGLALESLLTVSIAVPLAYTLNKLMREEWKPAEYLKKKAKKDEESSSHALPTVLKRDLGTSYFYLLSATSLYAAFNNVYIYYMIKGVITAKTHLPF